VVRTQTQNLDAAISGGWVAAVGALLILLALVDAFRTRKVRSAVQGATGNTLRGLAPGLWVGGLLAAFALALKTFGYFWCAAVFLAVYLRSFGQYAWWQCVLAAVAFAGASTWLFAAMRVQLPGGVLGWP
jgi:hypothetical protein